LSTNVSRSVEEEREQHERGEEEARDLRDRVLDDRDREVGLPFAASVIPTTFSTALPAIADDHEPGERLRDPERLDRRVERVDEPVRDERGRDAAAPAGRRRRGTAGAVRRLARAPARAGRSAGTTRATRA
jgi:hypothetical protein